MPLNTTTLTEAILDLTDDTRASFVGFPSVLDASGQLDEVATNQLVAQNWANAAGLYFAQIIVPALLPTGIPAGVAAFQGAMFPLLGIPGGAADALQAGFLAFSLAIVANTAPPNVSTPPSTELVIPIGPPTVDPLPPATNIANAVFAWSKTGLTGAPPQPPSIPWS